MKIKQTTKMLEMLAVLYPVDHSLRSFVAFEDLLDIVGGLRIAQFCLSYMVMIQVLVGCNIHLKLLIFQV